MMLKPKEVCQKLGMSYRTLQSYVKEGYIKPVATEREVEVQGGLRKTDGYCQEEESGIIR